MQLTTIKKNSVTEYAVDWAGPSIRKSDKFIIQMPEVRPLATLISEFDGVERMETSGEPGQPDQAYDGTMRLSAASRLDDGYVQITLEKGGDGK